MRVPSGLCIVYDVSLLCWRDFAIPEGPVKYTGISPFILHLLVIFIFAMLNFNVIWILPDICGLCGYAWDYPSSICCLSWTSQSNIISIQQGGELLQLHKMNDYALIVGTYKEMDGFWVVHYWELFLWRLKSMSVKFCFITIWFSTIQKGMN